MRIVRDTYMRRNVRENAWEYRNQGGWRYPSACRVHVRGTFDGVEEVNFPAKGVK